MNLFERLRVEDELKSQISLTKEELKVIFDVIDSNLDGFIDHYEVRK